MRAEKTHSNENYKKEDTRESKARKLKEEYSEYLDNLNDDDITKIALSNHFQLFNIAGVK